MEKGLQKRKELIFKIALCAIMAALAIALDKVSVNVERFKITFYALPLIVVGITNGVTYGLIAGIVSGIVLQLTSPYGIGPTSVFWALAPVAWGGVSGLVNFLFKNKIKNHLILYSIAIVIASIVANLVNTFAMIMDSLLVKDSYYTMSTILVGWPMRLLLMVICWVPYIVITTSVVEALNKAFGFNEKEEEENTEPALEEHQKSEKNDRWNLVSIYLIILGYTVNIFLIINMINEKTKYYSIIISSCIIIISILSCILETIFIKKESNNLEKRKKIISILLLVLSILLILISIFTLIYSIIIVSK